MERIEPPQLDLPARAWRALTTRGPRYTLHKALRRTPGRWRNLKRCLLYSDPRSYWTLRGGADYFREQEGQHGRAARAEWIADRIASYRPRSILEVGCGYGKQIARIRERLGDVPIVGIDFSPSQLAQARRYLGDDRAIRLVHGSGDRLPFPEDSFDLVFSSAVILHNPPPIADLMRLEIVRVARRWAAHNEDTDVTYNRYGYDTAAWYRARGIALAEVGPIATDPDGQHSQFCVARLNPDPVGP